MSFRGPKSTWDWHPSMEAYPGQYQRLLKEAEGEDFSHTNLSFPSKREYLRDVLPFGMNEQDKKRLISYESNAYDFKKIRALQRKVIKMENQLESIRPFKWEMTKVRPFRYSTAQARLADVRREILSKKIKEAKDKIKYYPKDNTILWS